MLIKNLSKEIDAKEMTAVHGGSADSQVYVPVTNLIEQMNVNKVTGNSGPVQIDNNNSATVTTDVSAPTNYGAILDLGAFVRTLLPSL
jgi:hypothetical protein